MSRSTALRARLTDLRVRGTQVVDRIPGARRAVADLIRIEVVDRSMIIAAQALLALTPLLIVLVAFLPADLGAELVGRFEDLMSIEVRSTLTRELGDDPSRSRTGLLGLLVVLASALSFAKAVQRLHERVWDLTHRGGLVGRRLCLVWLVGWLAYLQLAALVGQVLRDGGSWDVVRVVAQVVVSTLAWWWTAHSLLGGRVPWRRLCPGAVATAVGAVALVQASRVVMPAYAADNVAQFGPFGLVFSMASWLIAFASVMVVATVLGRVAVEEWPSGRVPATGEV